MEATFIKKKTGRKNTYKEKSKTNELHKFVFYLSQRIELSSAGKQ